MNLKNVQILFVRWGCSYKNTASKNKNNIFIDFNLIRIKVRSSLKILLKINNYAATIRYKAIRKTL